MAAPGALVPRRSAAVSPLSIPVQSLMRMSAMEIITTYGKDVYDLVAYLQGAGLVARDGRSNEDLALQEAWRREIELNGDCDVSDFYKEEMEKRRANR